MGATTDNNIVSFRLATFVAIILVVISFTFSVAGFYFSTSALDDRIKASDKRMVEEVGGLRSDWERENKHNEEDFKELKEEIKKLKEKK